MEEIKLLIPKDRRIRRMPSSRFRQRHGRRRAAIFAGDLLLRMYTKYIESKGWRCEITSSSDGAAEGFKEVVLKSPGQNVYGTLNTNRALPRAARTPDQTQGRVHTSAASVAVLPEAEEFDIEISMNDVRKDIFCASGPGGQSVSDLFGHPPDASDGHRRTMPESEVAVEELRQGFEETAGVRVSSTSNNRSGSTEIASSANMVSAGDRSAKSAPVNLPRRAASPTTASTVYRRPLSLHGRRHPGLHFTT